jgi:hypothetical protein
VYDFAWGDTQWGPASVRWTDCRTGCPGRRELKAASPDGVVYRVRAVKHKPAAGLAFWVEALATRMEAAGYVALRDEPVTAATPGDGALMEFTAPLGPDDATYLVGVFVRGRRLVLVEAAGEVATFEARRPAVIEAIRGL